MSYDSYKAYLANSTNPMQQYHDDLQAMINMDFVNASNLYTIKEELIKGSKVFTNALVRIIHVINSETGTKLGDDWRGLIFSSIDHVDGLGYLYQFDENYWLTISSDMYKFVTASATVRRCNNTLKWYSHDINNNRILNEEPCIIDYQVTRDLVKYGQEITLPQADIYVITQNNQNTKDIKINDRFLFDGEPFKVQMKNNWQRDQTMVVDSAPLIYLSLFKDQISPLDDLENNIANGLPASDINNTNIIISPNNTKILQGENQEYSVCKYDFNNNILADTFTITANGCDSSFYSLNIINGNKFNINNIAGDGAEYLTVHCVDNVDGSVEDIKIRLAGEW
jgi:hypothetical protein